MSCRIVHPMRVFSSSVSQNPQPTPHENFLDLPKQNSSLVSVEPALPGV